MNPYRKIVSFFRTVFWPGPLTDVEIDNNSGDAVSKFMTNTRLKLLCQNAHGGFFKADLFALHTGKKGVMLWFCYDTGNAELFLALEQLDDYDPANPPDKPVAAKLVRSATFTLNGVNPASPSAIVGHFGTALPFPTSFSSLSNSDVVRYIKQFEQEFNPTYCKLNFSFFTEDKNPGTPAHLSNKFLTKFVNAIPNGYVRYYFGYDSTKATNQIRLTLVAIDQYGNRANMTNLESSWPPPPY